MAYIYDMTDTWNSIITTYTAIKMNVTDTASAAGSLLMDLQVGGTSKARISKTAELNLIDNSDAEVSVGSTSVNKQGSLNIAGLIQGSANYVSWANNTNLIGATTDLFLYRDAANTLAQRNGTNAQEFRIYNTYTDVNNYERLSHAWVGNYAYIKTEAAGTGTARAFILQSASTEGFYFQVVSSNIFRASDNGLTFPSDNIYDIGSEGAARPRRVFPGMVVKYASLTLASLSASVIGAASAGAGAMAYISDGNVPIVFTTVAGGGTTPCPVYSDGTQWRAG